MRDAVRLSDILEAVDEEIEDLVRRQLLVLMLGLQLDLVADRRRKRLRQPEAEIVLENEANSASSGLAVDTDDIRIVAAADVCRIDRQIRHRPEIRVLLFSVMHAL